MQSTNSGSQRSPHQAVMEYLAHAGEAVAVDELKMGIGLGEQGIESVIEELVRKGQVKRPRGRGRRIYLVTEPCGFDDLLREFHYEPRFWKKENDAYRALARKLEREWMPALGFSDVCVAITAHQGRRNTGGVWSRPDLVATGQHPTLPPRSDRRLAVTFEVKLAHQFDLRAIHEANAQRIHRDASAAFVLVVVTKAGLSKCLENHFSGALKHAKDTDVGLILLGASATDLEWCEIHMPREWERNIA